MGDVSFSMRIDAEVKARLDHEAEVQNLSVTDLAERAIQNYLDNLENKRSAIGEAAREADKGIFISKEAMDRWIDGWTNDDETPPPAPDLSFEPRKR